MKGASSLRTSKHNAAGGTDTRSGNRAVACPGLIICARDLNSWGTRHGTFGLRVFIFTTTVRLQLPTTKHKA